MDLSAIWTIFKGFFIDLVKYGFPSMAIVLSVLSYIDSRKAKKIQKRLYDVEEKLKQYALEEKEKEREEATKACVEARVVKISENRYVLKIWNSGKATAYNVNYNIPKESQVFVHSKKVPFEHLESGKNFEEHIIVHGGTSDKFTVTTTWTDKEGKPYSKENLTTI